MSTILEVERREWAERVFRHALLRDKRLRRRLILIANGVLERPAGTIAGVFKTPADLCGAYDFIENDAVPPEALALSVAISTAQMARQFSSIYVPTDGSSVSVTDRKKTKGTGTLGTRKTKARGDKIHTALAVSPDGIVLGLCSFLQWQRSGHGKKASRAKRETKDKETQKWIDARAQTRDVFAEHAPGTRLHFLHDREADAWAVVLDAIEHRENEDTTLRAAWDRRLWHDGPTGDDETRKLRDALAKSPISGTYDLAVSAGKNRTARVARMHVRSCEVTLDLRDKRTSRHSPARVYAVLAREMSAVPGKEKPVEWLLLTTVPVTDFASACEVIRGYSLRWRIERFYLTWKSAGTDVESTQLEAADHRARWEIILAAVATALLRWSLLARETPNKPASEEWTEEQLTALRDVAEKGTFRPGHVTTVYEVVIAIGHLGGWLKQKGKLPGPKILARGWKEVASHMRSIRRMEQRIRRELEAKMAAGK